jgi:hypothetical protein
MNSTPHLAERPFAAVLLSIFEDIQELVRSEARLAKAEVREELAGMTLGAGWLVAGIAGAFFAICFMLLAAFLALSSVVPQWAAALILAGALAIVSGVSFAVRTSNKTRRLLSGAPSLRRSPKESTA